MAQSHCAIKCAGAMDSSAIIRTAVLLIATSSVIGNRALTEPVDVKEKNMEDIKGDTVEHLLHHIFLGHCNQEYQDSQEYCIHFLSSHYYKNTSKMFGCNFHG